MTVCPNSKIYYGSRRYRLPGCVKHCRITDSQLRSAVLWTGPLIRCASRPDPFQMILVYHLLPLENLDFLGTVVEGRAPAQQRRALHGGQNSIRAWMLRGRDAVGVDIMLSAEMLRMVTVLEGDCVRKSIHAPTLIKSTPTTSFLQTIPKF